MVIISIDDDFKEDEMMMELYAVECFVKVEQEGPSDFCFETVGGGGDDANTVGDPTAQEILPDVVQENHKVDCDEVHGAGVEVDDDNLPAPENIKGEWVEYGEMLCFFGLWFLMSTQLRPQHCEYSSSAMVNEFEGAPI